MSYTALATLALAFFAQMAYASPARTLPVADTVLVPTAADFTSTAKGGIHAEGTVSSILMVCTEAACGGVCSNIALPLQFDTCLGAPAFNSLAVLQQYNEALGYGVWVGPSGCQSFAQIPQINTCYNVNGGPWTDFEVTE